MHREMRKALVSIRMAGRRFKKRVVVVPRQSNAIGARDDVGPWTGDRKHLQGNPAGIHICDARVTELGQLVSLEGLAPDDIGCRNGAAATGGRIGLANDGRTSVSVR